jgi:hypothetical protein
MPTAWWLRPESSAARVGEQSAVVWKRVYFRPVAASRSALGVRHGPPNALDAPKPTSSSRTISTLGAPVGGRSGRIGGNFVSGSFASSVVRPTGLRSGIGNTSRGTQSRRSIVPSESCWASGIGSRRVRGPWRRSVRRSAHEMPCLAHTTISSNRMDCLENERRSLENERRSTDRRWTSRTCTGRGRLSSAFARRARLR